MDEQGSGTYEVTTDMIPMMRNMAYQFAVLANNVGGDDSVGGSIDSANIESQLFKDFPNEVDSIIPLHKMTKEASLSVADKAKLEKQLKLYMKGGRSSGQMIMGMQYHFTSIPDLNELGAIMERNKEKSEDSRLDEYTANVTYAVQGNTLRRTYTERMKREKQEEPEERLSHMMFGETVYRTTLRSKRKIKKVNALGIKSQKDHEIVLEYPMKDYLNGQVNMNFEIEWE